MGLSDWLKHVLNLDVAVPISKEIYTNYDELIKSLMSDKIHNIYFTKNEEFNINDEFLTHDGYFTKLINQENKVIGYIFRCTHRNVEVVTKDNKKKVIPFLVTCFYQPALPFTSNKIIKTLGKAQALKSGVRIIKRYVLNTGDIDLDLLNDENNCLSLKFIFPESIDKDNECFKLSEQAYKNILDYVKAFDNKVFKYYHDIDEKNIIKIWLKN